MVYPDRDPAVPQGLFQPGAFLPRLFEATQVRLDSHDRGQLEQRHVVRDLAGKRDWDRIGIRGGRDALVRARRGCAAARRARCAWSGAGRQSRAVRRRRREVGCTSTSVAPVGRRPGPCGPVSLRARGVEGESADALDPSLSPRRSPDVTPLGVATSLRQPGNARQGRRSQRGGGMVRLVGRTNSGIGKWRPRGVAAILQAPLSGKRRVSQSLSLRTGRWG